jgi:signal transduction histidine kinase
MGCVTQVSAPLRPGLLPATGVALAILAVVEVVVRGENGAPLVNVIVLALGTTLPLTVARAQVRSVAAVILAGTVLTLALGQRLPVAGVAALLVAASLLGRQRLQRVRRQAVEQEASRQTVQQTLLENVARGERARIARELHDVVAHHISMIAVQAETARLTTPGMPSDGAKRLLAIGDTARAALTDMRGLLGVLREDAGPEPGRRPQPGLRELNELLDECRDSSGASTRLIVRGPVAALDPALELAAYRIVQEGLTNARRHAPGAAVDVELEYAADQLTVRIRDNGPGPGTTASGHGLQGMRERVATVGGRLRTGAAPVNGFLVEARLPVIRVTAKVPS